MNSKLNNHTQCLSICAKTGIMGIGKYGEKKKACK